MERTRRREAEGERERESGRVSPKRTIRESFGVSIGVLVQVDSCDSETHCPGCGGSEFLILNKTDLALHWPNRSEILAVATQFWLDDSIFGPNCKTRRARAG